MEGVISSRNYCPGDIIYSESAFAKVLARQYKDTICEFCCKNSFTLKACKGCLAVKYCGKECQKKDWSSHKLECEYLKNLPNARYADFVRLLGKVILKTKGKDWKNIKSKVLGKDFSFDDIDSNYKDMTENPRLMLFFYEIKELTGKYIGFENLPDDEHFIKIIGKLRSRGYITKVLGLFIGAAMFNTECIPTSNATICGSVIRIWASKKIKKGENKITVPGRMIITSPLSLSPDRYLSCKCEDCSLPYGESILSKIIDKKTAFSLICETERFLDAADVFSDALWYPELKETADELLNRMEGVLGDTNHLHLELLTVRCLNMRDNPVQTKILLLKLERLMKSIFGEYYIEMFPIYKALFAINMTLGCPRGILEYSRKVFFMEQHINFA